MRDSVDWTGAWQNWIAGGGHGSEYGEYQGNVGKLELDVREMRASLEQKFGAMQQEFCTLTRFLIGVVISFFTTLVGFRAAILGVLAKAFHWLR
jgi:hypothetical protein